MNGKHSFPFRRFTEDNLGEGEGAPSRKAFGGEDAKIGTAGFAAGSNDRD